MNSAWPNRSATNSNIWFKKTHLTDYQKGAELFLFTQVMLFSTSYYLIGTSYSILFTQINSYPVYRSLSAKSLWIKEVIDFQDFRGPVTIYCDVPFKYTLNSCYCTVLPGSFMSNGKHGIKNKYSCTLIQSITPFVGVLVSEEIEANSVFWSHCCYINEVVVISIFKHRRHQCSQRP